MQSPNLVNGIKHNTMDSPYLDNGLKDNSMQRKSVEADAGQNHAAPFKRVTKKYTIKFKAG